MKDIIKDSSKQIEKKWQVKWEKAKLFETDTSSKKKFFLLHPYPYVNLAAHIGHSFTFYRTDVYARFMRLSGYNVLFPQGFHATGEPIVGVAERIKKNDKLQIDTLKLAGASDEDIQRFAHDPKYIAEFWMKRCIKDFKKAGLSIDWRRTFITTTMTPTYSRFIEWQYNTLRKKGYVVQGTHPVIWCPHDKSPTGDHDRLKGEGVSVQEYSALKYHIKQGGRTIYLPCATLRPETIYGVTNLWINPDAEYVIAKVIIKNSPEYWLVSKHAAEKLKDQKRVESVEHYTGESLVGKRCIDPISNTEIPILPAKFVMSDVGTGLVTSVPGHAPWDCIVVKEIIEQGEYAAPGELQPMPVVRVGEKENYVEEVLKDLKIKDSDDVELLEKAKQIIYKKEHHDGIMINSGPYTGMKVSEAKIKMMEDFKEKNIADVFYDTEDEVICRCSTRCHVKLLENQWFIKYSDEKWKAASKKHIEKMNVHPEEARNNLIATVDWLKDKACARKGGMGTPVPWDKEWIVETLSDSTIYMAYFTLSALIKKKKINASKLTDEVFDFIFCGTGDLKQAAKKSKLNAKIIKNMRDEFLYFYPFDIQNSGKDLVQNHLTFFVMQHIALFPKNLWPKGIAVNGYVNVEGQKMSKSKGNVILWSDAVEQYGTDLVRMNIACSAEDIDDADWHAENIKGYRQRLEFLMETAQKLKKAKGTKKTNIDFYLESKISGIIADSITHYRSWRFRSACQRSFFDSTNELKWYIKRKGGIENANKTVLKNALSVIFRLIAPIAPHMAEELWTTIGNKPFIAVAEWPKPYQADKKAEDAEIMIKEIIEDVEKIKSLAKIQAPKKVTLFVADQWKFDVYDFVLKNKKKEMGATIGEIMKSGKYGNATVSFIQNLYKKINELKPVATRSAQISALKDASVFFKSEIKCPVEVIEKSDHPKSNAASPAKPGILVE